MIGFTMPLLPGLAGGQAIGGHQIDPITLENFGRSSVLLARVPVWFNKSTVYLYSSAIFSHIAPRKPPNQGHYQGPRGDDLTHRGATF